VRLGIFGGTFDPPHVGHLLAASDAFEHLSLDRIVFIPAALQPLKVGRSAAPSRDRLAMVRLLTGSDARFEADPVEVDREGLSYTVDTLRGFRDRFPLADRYFLVGADVLPTFTQWREPQEILSLATLAVLTRRDDGEPVTAVGVPANAVMVPTRRIDVSSTEIRDRVRAGRSIRGFVTDAVAEYVSSNGLYR
jgi:nicotinate-nucleotide adenylyltransferase